MNRLSADDLIKMLRVHYRLDDNKPDDFRVGGLLATEVMSPNGGRRADALYVPVALNAVGTGITGYEIKVSRADLLHELQSPHKADPWFQYCTYWWLFVADPAIIENLLLEIPPAWGICAPPAGRRTKTLTIIRPAIKLSPKPSDEGWRRIVSHLTYAGEKERQQLAQKLWQATNTAERQAEQIAAYKSSGVMLSKEDRDIQEQILAIRQAIDAHRKQQRALPSEERCHVGTAAIAPQDVADALLDYAAIRHLTQDARKQLEYTIERVKLINRPLESVARQLAAIEFKDIK